MGASKANSYFNLRGNKGGGETDPHKRNPPLNLIKVQETYNSEKSKNNCEFS